MAVLKADLPDTKVEMTKSYTMKMGEPGKVCCGLVYVVRRESAFGAMIPVLSLVFVNEGASVLSHQPLGGARAGEFVLDCSSHVRSQTSCFKHRHTGFNTPLLETRNCSVAPAGHIPCQFLKPEI